MTNKYSTPALVMFFILYILLSVLAVSEIYKEMEQLVNRSYIIKNEYEQM